MSESERNRTIIVGLVFLGRKRPGFDPEWGALMEQKVRALAEQSGFDIWEPSEKVVDDPSLRIALTDAKRADVDAVVALQTTMADARMATTFAQLWTDPVLLWATPENPEGDLVSSCSLVGLHAWASILRHLDRPFEILYGDIDDANMLSQFQSALRLALTLRQLRAARVGLIGGQAPGFIAMAVEPLAAQRRLGPQVQPFTLTDFAAAVEAVGEDAVAEDVARVKAMPLPHKDTADDDLPVSSRLYLALRGYFEQEGFDALASRCWPEMPNEFGQWPYLAMARLADEGFAIACEGDVDGALTALIGESLGLGRAYLTDWLEHGPHGITLWHGGAAPMSLCCQPGGPGAPQIARHFNNKKPAVVDATIRAGMPATICRLWHRAGDYYLTSCDAETLQPQRHLLGTNSLAQPIGRDPHEWFADLCHQGMPHHVTLFEGHHTDLLRQFARTAGMRFIS